VVIETALRSAKLLRSAAAADAGPQVGRLSKIFPRNETSLGLTGIVEAAGVDVSANYQAVFKLWYGQAAYVRVAFISDAPKTGSELGIAEPDAAIAAGFGRPRMLTPFTAPERSDMGRLDRRAISPRTARPSSRNC